MATTIPVPHLGGLGWATNPDNKLDLLLSHFYESDFNQTLLYPKQVSQLQRVIQANGSRTSAVVGELQRTLETYLRRYFKQVTVEVNIANEETNQTINDTLTVLIEVYDDNQKLLVPYAVSTRDGRFSNFIKINNEVL